MFVKALARVPIINGLDIEYPTILKFLYNRNIRTIGDYEKNYLISALEDPSSLFDVLSFAKTLMRFIKEGKRIVIYGDYDADGIISSYILYDFLTSILGYKLVWVWLPNRFRDGYGLNEKNITYIKEFADVIITVDCGIRDAELINKYKKILDFLIIDHHLIPEQLPNVPIVHPLLPKGKNKNKITSAGVTVYKFVSYLAKFLNLPLQYEQQHLDKYLELAATTIVTDVMPLIGENRLLVQMAYHRLNLNNTRHTFIQGILDSLGLSGRKFSYNDFGFIIGPRLNAVGRIMDPNIAFASILMPDPSKLKILNSINTYRKELVSNVDLQEVDFYKENEFAILVYSANLSEGLIGLVAGNLVKKHNKLSIVCSLDQEGNIKCSGRSPKGINIISLLDRLNSQFTCFLKHGGHSQAAGLTLDPEIDIKTFWKFLDQETKNILEFEPFILVDDVLRPDDLTIDLLNMIQKFEPFGAGNEEIKLVLEGNIESFRISTNGRTVLTMSDFNSDRMINVYFKGDSWVSFNSNRAFILGKPFLSSNGEVLFWGDAIVNRIEFIL